MAGVGRPGPLHGDEEKECEEEEEETAQISSSSRAVRAWKAGLLSTSPLACLFSVVCVSPEVYHLCKSDYRFDTLQFDCFRINLKL